MEMTPFTEAKGTTQFEVTVATIVSSETRDAISFRADSEMTSPTEVMETIGCWSFRQIFLSSLRMTTEAMTCSMEATVTTKSWEAAATIESLVRLVMI